MPDKYSRKETSPDGTLTLIAYVDEGDYTIGFAGSEWHTHGDFLVPAYGGTPKEATDAFFNSIIGDQQVIAIQGMPGEPPGVSVTDDPGTLGRYAPPEEKRELRYWSGRKYDP